MVLYILQMYQHCIEMCEDEIYRILNAQNRVITG
jgi:hypothetical protein